MSSYQIYVLSHRCKGPNLKCKAASKEGRPVHMNINWDENQPTLVQPTHHFASEDHGLAMINSWLETARTITTDDELYAARDAGVPHFLPVGWIDPSRR